MTIQTETLNKTTLDRPLLSKVRLNGEIAAYITLFILAIITRFYDLGARVMSHDESLHTLYSWNLYAGKGYVHDPLMHGPFLFHFNAFIYFLFGDNDFTARISVAVFGVILVILPYWFRPWLGKIGALATASMILISPGLLYYSRYIRHDAFINVWTVLMLLAFFQYMRTRAHIWMYVGWGSIFMMLSTKEVAYIHGFIGLTFILLMLIWESVPRTWQRLVEYILLALTIGMGGLAVFLLNQAETLGEPEAAGTMALLVRRVDVIVAATIMLVAALFTKFSVDRKRRPVSKVVEQLSDRRLDLFKAGGALMLFFGALLSLLVFVLQEATVLIQFPPEQQMMVRLGGGVLIIALCGGALFLIRDLSSRWIEMFKAILVGAILFALFHTTFFSNIRGLYTGTMGEVVYWLEQHDVQRGGQPWYYYLMLMPLYEFLPLLIGLGGTLVYLISRGGFPAHADEEYEAELARLKEEPEAEQRLWPSDGGTFFGFMLYWAIASFTIYSWAGEKMPWLTVHLTLPLTFVAGHVIQTAFNHFDWQSMRQKNGLPLMGAILLIIPALGAVLTNQPFRSQSLQAVEETFAFLLGLVVLGLIVWVGWLSWQKMGRHMFGQVLLSTVLLLMVLLTIRFSWMFNYINYDYVSEPLVYAHGSPDVKLLLNQIDDISRRTVGDKMIKVAYDNESTWPMEWYMREYPNRAYYGENPNRDALDAPIVIVGSNNESKVTPYLGDDYTKFAYRMVWWPIEDYKNYQTGMLPKLWNDYVMGENAAANRVSLWNIFFYRSYNNYELNEWPFVSRFNLYVRNDLLNEVWDYQSSPMQLPQGNITDVYAGKRLDELPAIDTISGTGSGNAQFNAPRNVAVGPNGRIYVADTGNHRVQVFDETGGFLFTFGESGTEAGQFNEPWDIAVSDSGQVYVSDIWNNRIQMFDDEGEFVGQFGGYTNAQSDPELDPGLFWGPRGLALDPEGNLYVADTGNKRIQVFSPEGEFVQLWGGGGVIAGKFEEPVGVAVDLEGNIYVTDTWNRRVQKFAPDLTPVAEWEVVGWQGEGIYNKPFIAVNDQQWVFISDPENYRIIAYTDTGELLGTWGQFGRDLASFSLPTGLAFDEAGQLLVADADNHRIMRFIVPTFEQGEQSP